MMTDFECPKCGGAGFYFKQGNGTRKSSEKIICVCSLVKKYITYAPNLLSSLIRLDEEERKKIYNCFTSSARNYFFRLSFDVSEDIVKSIILSFCITKKSKPFVLLNIYELIEIFLSKHPVYNSFFDIKTPLCILLQGYAEFRNVRQFEFVLQFLNILREETDVLYISREEVANDVLQFFIQSGWKMIERRAGEYRIYNPDLSVPLSETKYTKL